jgi:ankyrin repeat protein
MSKSSELELVKSIYQSDVASLERLLLVGSDVNRADAHGLTLLMHAVLADPPNESVIKTLLTKGADVNARDRDHSWTCLHFAAEALHSPIVALLLRSGAEVSPRDTNGNTPLMRATLAATNEAPAINVLLEFGADPFEKNNSGVSASDLAIRMNKERLIALFSQLKCTDSA